MHHPRRARALPIAVTVAIALLGAACSDDDGDTAQVESRIADQSETTGTTEASGLSQDAGDDVETGDDGSTDQNDGSDDGGGSLGSTTGQQPARIGNDVIVPLRIEVTSLRRNGELVELAMTMTNEHEDADFDPTSEFKDAEQVNAEDDISGVRLIDQAERRAYLPVLDSASICLCTYELDDVTIAAGESLELHASFGGIPDDVTTLDLDVPGFEPITGLEVQG